MLLALERAEACAERWLYELWFWSWGSTYAFICIAHVVGEHLVDYFLKGQDQHGQLLDRLQSSPSSTVIIEVDTNPKVRGAICFAVQVRISLGRCTKDRS